MPHTTAPGSRVAGVGAKFPVPDPSFGGNRHVALIYDGAGDSTAAAAAFLGEGLARAHLSVYVDDAHAQERIVTQLWAAGADPGAAMQSGQLTLAKPEATFVADGHFDPDVMIGVLEAAVARAKLAGYGGLFIAGEMSWALGRHTGAERLDEYEARCTEFFSSSPAVSLCMYDRRRFDAAALRKVLISHPWVFLAGRLVRNYHHVPAGVAAQDALAGLRDIDAVLDDLVIRDAAERIVAGTAIAIEGSGADELAIRLDDASRLARIYSELVLFKSQVLVRTESKAPEAAGARHRQEHARTILRLRGELLGLQHRLDFWQDRVRRTVGLDYDPDELRVQYGSRSVRLSRRESQLIAALISQNGRSLAARELLWRAWGGNHLSEAQVRTYVVQLRKKLAGLEMPAALVNEPGVGYSLRFDPEHMAG